MTLRIHSGVVRIESWRPGSKDAGASDDYEIGNFAEDVILIGLYRDPETGTGSASITVTLEAPSPAGKRSIFDSIPEDSLLFAADAQGYPELNIPIPAKESFKLSLEWAGTATAGFLLLFGAPIISYDQFAALTQRAEAPKAGALRR